MDLPASGRAVGGERERAGSVADRGRRHRDHRRHRAQYDYHRAQYEWYRAHSVTEAVDLLAALGYLPARFSSAWWAGWNAAAMDLALADYRAETSK
jgi:hypothetical protein